MAAPYSFENTIRIHDEAILNWLAKCKVDYGTISGVDRNNTSILRVFAAPHRAFATTVDQLVQQGWVQESDPAISNARATYDWPVLPLPILTIERDDPIISNELANPAAVFRGGGVDPVTGHVQDLPYPRHYLTQYRVTLWSEKRYTHAHFMEWLMSEIGHVGAWQREVLIPVQHGLPWGTLAHALRYQGSADLSDLEGFEARHIRSQISFTLRSWFFPSLPAEGGPPIYTIASSYYASTQIYTSLAPNGDLIAPAAGTVAFCDPYYVMPDAASFELFPQSAGWATANLFTMSGATATSIASLWPVEGNASVILSPYSPVGVQATVRNAFGYLYANPVPGVLPLVTLPPVDVLNPLPQVSAISPTAGALIGGTAVTLTGLNLTGATGITFGGVAATAVVVTPTSITCVTPMRTPGGPVAVVVQHPDGDVTVTGDVVQLGQFLTTPDINGFSIWSVMAKYRGTGPWDLLGRSYVPAAGGASLEQPVQVFNQPFPANVDQAVWQHLHAFTITQGVQFDWSVGGDSSSATATAVDLNSVDIRQINTGVGIAPFGSTTAGGFVTYTWQNLTPTQPYLLIVLLYQAIPYITGTVTAADDAVSPVATYSRTVIVPGSLGVVLLMQPQATSLALQVPTGFVVAGVYAQSFDGFTIGNSI